MKTDQKLNMTMLCDFYELTMGNGYLKAGSRIALPISTFISAPFPTAAATPSQRVSTS